MKHKISGEMKRCNLLQSEIDTAYHEVAKRFGLSDSTLIILYTICMFGESCPLSEIVHLSAMSKQTVNSALRNMERDGLIVLASSSAKTKAVILTEKGKALSERTAIPLMGAEDAVFASWSREDVENYVRLTERFLTDLKKEIKKL